MSYHVIPCHTRFFDVPLHHSAAVSFNPFLHFFCGLLLPKDDSRTSKTVDEDNGAIMRNLTFLAQLHQLRCSVSTPATATCDATGLCFCLRESMILSQETQNAKVNSKQQNLAVDMCGSSNGTPMDPHGLFSACFSTSLSRS